MSKDECLKHLATTQHGRVVFSELALPAIRPSRHLVHEGELYILIRSESPLSMLVRNTNNSGVIVVAYEIDHFHDDARLAWYVTATGPAEFLRDGALTENVLSRLRRWTDIPIDVVRINPEIVSGYELLPAD